MYTARLYVVGIARGVLCCHELDALDAVANVRDTSLFSWVDSIPCHHLQRESSKLLVFRSSGARMTSKAVVMLDYGATGVAIAATTSAL